MRWARLLRAAERVEVLEIDAQTQRARIRRHGFEQAIPLSELIFEEEEPAVPNVPARTAPARASQEGISLSLLLKAGQPEITLMLLRDAATPAYVALYLRAGGASLWHPLWQEVFTPGLSRLFTLSREAYPAPWTLRLYGIGILSEPSGRLPEPQIYEATLRPLFFARSGTFPVEWSPLPDSKGSLAPSQIRLEHFPQPTASSYDFPRQAEIDLHIEKLAPHLLSAKPEVIFLYQKEVLERYLDWAYREKFPTVRIIHGKGELRLRSLLQSLCRQQGWHIELLTMPPYSGGASQIYFEATT